MRMLSYKPFIETMMTFVGIIYLVCAFFVFIAPTATLQFFSLWFHGIDLKTIASVPTLPNMIIGFITALVVTALASAVFVRIWNYFSSKEETS